MAKSRNKLPGKASDSASLKIPRGESVVGNYDSQQIAWHLRGLDLGGPFGWAGVLQHEGFAELFGALSAFETMTWAEIKANNSSHSVRVDLLSKAARDRLVEIEQDDVEELFSLRISGRRRVWGIQDRHILRLLWWDPEHEVFPTSPKHT
jgi:hypothetical protein